MVGGYGMLCMKGDVYFGEYVVVVGGFIVDVEFWFYVVIECDLEC